METYRTPRIVLSRLLSDYGMLLALVLLCLYYSAATWDKQYPSGSSGGSRLAQEITSNLSPPANILIVTRDTEEDLAFAEVLQGQLSSAGFTILNTVCGQPSDAKRALESLAGSGQKLNVIAANQVTGSWAVLAELEQQFPGLGSVSILTPTSYSWPNFLKGENLLNVANQISVIAILAVGMTLVIISAGIDLSVGSLIAFSAVLSTLLIRELGGAIEASTLGMILSCLVGILACALLGTFSGLMVTVFSIPPFIATLSMMLVASGLAFLLARGQSIYELPNSFVWLGRGSDLGLPNAVVLMLALYAGAHILMTRTAVGRSIYAVGGNTEAARLSGIRVSSILVLVYSLSGALAGLGGVVMASQLKSGSPTYGQMYELYVIAAVIVGGCSLSGGEGKIFGTLIGAFIIAVIQNGMNLTGIESYTQKVVLGLIILGAVLLDRVKRSRWPRR